MKYHAYNLCLDSEFPLRLPTNEAEADVVIRRGSVPAEGLPSPVVSRAFAQVAGNTVWMNVPGIGRFLIENGERITVEPLEKATDEGIQLYLQGSGMGAILLQREHLVLHASAVRVGGVAVLFAGDSGTGKSTTTAVLHQRGYQVIADDLVAVSQEQRAIAGFPSLKMWQDALHQLELPYEKVDVVRPPMRKYWFPLERFAEKEPPVKAVYFLGARNHENDEFEFEPITGITKFERLKEQTYRPNFVEGLGLKSKHLRLAGKMAGNIVSAAILRPSRQFNAVQLVDRILEHLRESGLSTDPEA